jgi:tetratricopeptide (TPR) repeat protein
VQELRTALQLNPDAQDLAGYLARAWSGGVSAPASATPAMDEAPPPASGDTRRGLAAAMWREGHQLAAISILKQGLRQDPRNVAWLCDLGLFLGAREEHDQAVNVLRQALDLDPARSQARVHLALCLGSLGQCREAAEHLVLAHCQEPSDTRTSMLLAMACDAAGAAAPQPAIEPQTPANMEIVGLEDLEALAGLIEREPEVVQAFAALPAQESEGGMFQRLAAALRLAIERRPQHAELHYHLGRVQALLGEPEQAITCYEQALQIDGRMAPALIALAKQCCSERPGEAMAALERVLQMGCEYADVHYLLGCLYRDQGDADRARRSYSRALHLNARYRAAREALESLAA